SLLRRPAGRRSADVSARGPVNQCMRAGPFTDKNGLDRNRVPPPQRLEHVAKSSLASIRGFVRSLEAGCGDERPGAAMEQWSRRRPDQGVKAAEATDARASGDRALKAVVPENARLKGFSSVPESTGS